ncbi:MULTISPECIES: hypothetical protein [unclassified Nocardioides]|uniref:hypothetical protein n=1 Tax=unclassified Nocardioides TaxID=2615069 RepID=UPI00301471C3
MTRVLAALLALLVPVLVSTADAPGAATIAVVALALATLVAVASYGGLPVVRVARPVAVGDDAVPLVLRGRVVDPVAHPRRPRAPGRG